MPEGNFAFAFVKINSPIVVSVRHPTAFVTSTCREHNVTVSVGLEPFSVFMAMENK